MTGDAHHVPGGGVGQVLFGNPQAGAGQGVPPRGGVGGVHEVDRVGDPPGAAGVLRLHPGGALTLLDLAAFIQDQHRQAVRAGQVLHCEIADGPHRGALIPGGSLQQALHLARRGVACVLGQ